MSNYATREVGNGDLMRIRFNVMEYSGDLFPLEHFEADDRFIWPLTGSIYNEAGVFGMEMSDVHDIAELVDGNGWGDMWLASRITSWGSTKMTVEGLAEYVTRYMRIFGGCPEFQAEVRTYHGNTQGDAVKIIIGGVDAKRLEWAEEDAEAYASWLWGDVYTVTVETLSLLDAMEAEDSESANWKEHASYSGVIGESGIESALAEHGFVDVKPWDVVNY